MTSEDEGLRKYALQFVPDLMMVYLLAVTDNIAQVCARAWIACHFLKQKMGLLMNDILKLDVTSEGRDRYNDYHLG